MTTWKTMPENVPADAETVWVRRWWFGPPWQATWDLATQTFTDVIEGLTIPWHEVSRWRSL